VKPRPAHDAAHRYPMLIPALPDHQNPAFRKVSLTPVFHGDLRIAGRK